MPASDVSPPEYTFTVNYETALFNPPHSMTIRSSINGWEDIPMIPKVGEEHTIWSGEVRTDLDAPVEFEYKLVLDGEHWQEGGNQQGVTAKSPEGASFDDNNLSWEN